MPDISMCNGESCPKKETCYRFKAEPNPYRQSYFSDNPCDEKYEYYSHMSKKDIEHEEEKKFRIEKDYVK